MARWSTKATTTEMHNETGSTVVADQFTGVGMECMAGQGKGAAASVWDDDQQAATFRGQLPGSNMGLVARWSP